MSEQNPNDPAEQPPESEVVRGDPENREEFPPPESESSESDSEQPPESEVVRGDPENREEFTEDAAESEAPIHGEPENYRRSKDTQGTAEEAGENPPERPQPKPPAAEDQTLSDVIMESVNSYLKDVREGLELTKAEFKTFAIDAERQINGLIEEGDYAGLPFVKAQLDARIGRLALRQVMDHRKEILNIVMTVARTAIVLA